MPAWPRILRALFVAYVTLTAVHIGWVIHHEPFAFDAWNMASDTHAQPFSAGRFFDYWAFEWAHSNPRLGQPLTYLAYKLEYFSVIATPIAYLALAAAAFILGTGRRPSWRRDRDLALYAIALGFMWFVLPQIGKTLFCRAYCSNYVYGAVIQMWFLVPLRLVAKPRASLVACLGYAMFGVLAGACNEHTGPTLCLLLVAYAWWSQREQPQTPTLAWAGALGAVIGFCTLFFAPGQGQRYDSLAQRVSLPGRLWSRGFGGNLDLVRDLIAAAAPLLALMVLIAAVGMVREAGYAEQRARRTQALRAIVIAMAAGLLVAITMFVSPKLGPRFYLAPMVGMLAAFIALADAVLVSAEGFGVLVALALAASTYAAARTIPRYDRLARESTARLAQLEAAPRGAVVTLAAFDQLEDDWWFLGDDARAPNKREMIADYFGLSAVILRAYDPTAPLGVSDVRLVPSERGFELDAYRGLDLTSIHHAIEQAASARHETADVAVAVEFVGQRPTLPRPSVLVGRWTPRGLEGWAAKLERAGTTRTVVVPKTLPPDLEVYAYVVGGEAKRLGLAGKSGEGPARSGAEGGAQVNEKLHYTPWQTGTYWILACRPTECFVIAAARQGG
ncbi:MAG: DUF6056 family protein [Deltaproteobacteria bacterium]